MFLKDVIFQIEPNIIIPLTIFADLFFENKN